MNKDEIIYKINGNEVSKLEFDAYVNSHPEKDFINERLKKQSVCLVKSLSRKKSKWDAGNDFLVQASKNVFAIEQIVEDNEYDPLDDDALNIAFALDEEGYRKKEKTAREIFENILKRIDSLEYRAKTQRKTVTVEELNAQCDWIIHIVVPKTIKELAKEYNVELND